MNKALSFRKSMNIVFPLFIAFVIVACGSENVNQDPGQSQQNASVATESESRAKPVISTSSSDSTELIDASTDAGDSANKDDEKQLYTVTAENQVDPLTYAGYKLYQRVGCMACHGPTGEGGAAFPNLLEAVNRLSKEEVVGIAQNGKGIMPAHKDNSYLASYTDKNNLSEEQGFEAIYVYLKARSDGAIPAGRLKKQE